MIKYEVRKQSDVETPKGKTEWSVNDMLDCFERKTWTNLELVKAFDNLDDAKEFFENEKHYCQSRYTKGSTDNLVLFDVLTLEETEYDEDGDYIQGDQLDIYIAEIKCKKIV